jgi:hypothetical protein
VKYYFSGNRDSNARMIAPRTQNESSSYIISLMLALVGFLFSLIIHLLALVGRALASEYLVRGAILRSARARLSLNVLRPG